MNEEDRANVAVHRAAREAIRRVRAFRPSMNETDTAVVRAELVALQAVLIGLMRRIGRHAPEFAPVLCGAFDDAEAIVTGLAMKMDLADPAGSAIGALHVIEEMRAGVIKDEAACGGSPGRRS